MQMRQKNIAKTHEMMYFYKSYAYHKTNLRNEAKEQIRQAKLYCTKSSEYRIAMIDAFATYLYETKPFELKEKKLRIEDALNATKAAVAEGIVIGGGAALVEAYKELKPVT